MFHRFRRHGRRIATIVTACGLLIAVTATPALADPPTNQLTSVLDNARNWVMGIAGAVVVLMVTIAGLRYTIGSGSPAETEKAKTALTGALIGLAIVVLAPILVAILRGILDA